MIPSRKQRWLLKNGVAAPALVLKASDTGIRINYFNMVIKVTLRVMPKGEAPFEVTTEAFFQRIAPPIPGMTVYIKYDPNDKKSVVLLSQSDIDTATGLK